MQIKEAKVHDLGCEGPYVLMVPNKIVYVLLLKNRKECENCQTNLWLFMLNLNEKKFCVPGETSEDNEPDEEDSVVPNVINFIKINNRELCKCHQIRHSFYVNLQVAIVFVD